MGHVTAGMQVAVLYRNMTSRARPGGNSLWLHLHLELNLSYLCSWVMVLTPSQSSSSTAVHQVLHEPLRVPQRVAALHHTATCPPPAAGADVRCLNSTKCCCSRQPARRQSNQSEGACRLPGACLAAAASLDYPPRRCRRRHSAHACPAHNIQDHVATPTKQQWTGHQCH